MLPLRYIRQPTSAFWAAVHAASCGGLTHLEEILMLQDECMSSEMPLIGCAAVIDRGKAVCHPSQPGSIVNFAVLDSQPWMAVALFGFKLATPWTIGQMLFCCATQEFFICITLHTFRLHIAFCFHDVTYLSFSFCHLGVTQIGEVGTVMKPWCPSYPK